VDRLALSVFFLNLGSGGKGSHHTVIAASREGARKRNNLQSWKQLEESIQQRGGADSFWLVEGKRTGQAKEDTPI